MTHAQMFAFESDFVASMRCIPMSVRFKLDSCGIKLSLRQWSRFATADRRDLLHAPCGTDAEVSAYRNRLLELIRVRTDEPARELAVAPCGTWRDASRTPNVVSIYARAIGLDPPGDREWARLSELQRYVLVKLTRDNHDNVNFWPAMVEFSLTTSAFKAE